MLSTTKNDIHTIFFLINKFIKRIIFIPGKLMYLVSGKIGCSFSSSFINGGQGFTKDYYFGP